ncbi:hypothetical protein [Salisediminibacterium beveridgei]|uniref:hypothetical protein n=1 Tax=Salisediminibacterium beveridgei TaxID=632773 RepID=UPI0012ED68D9|nr:hypothetical protein [Salisediminibacterium beveridgei]
MTTLAENVSRWIVFGGLMYVIIQIIRHKKMLTSRGKLISQSKKESDERQQFLHDKSGGIVVDLLLLFILFITATTAMLNMPAFNTAVTILTVTIVLKVGSYLLYSKMY